MFNKKKRNVVGDIQVGFEWIILNRFVRNCFICQLKITDVFKDMIMLLYKINGEGKLHNQERLFYQK
jgi:hypothetical protein